ncbi:BamA/TamA family outer membrane protein [Candidatus Bipolaricaulota bacterium]|nr:BamA/TamA family outer membrane protein [Candidatus Bipolaricaulota bacterium]
MKINKEKLSIVVVLSILVLLVSFGATMSGQDEGNETKYVVIDISLSGNEEIDDEKILTELELEEGDSVTKSELEEKVNKVRDMGVFETVESSLDVADGEVSLELKLTEYPVLDKYEFTGANLLNTRKLKKVLKDAGIKKGKVINRDKLDEGLKNIQKKYEENGYPFVTVGNVDLGSTLSIEVIETKLTAIRVEGLDTVPEEVALDMIEAQKGEPVKLRALQRSYQNLQNSIYFTSVNLVPARGYSKSDVILRWELTERKIVDGVVEGTKLGLRGNTLYSSEELRKLIGEFPGGKVTNYDLLRAFEDVYGKYLKDGYRFVDLSFDRVKGDTILIRVFEGEISDITVEGNKKTARKVINNKILLSEGDVFNSELVADSRRRLLNLGYFSEVSPEPVKTSEGIELGFTVKEKSKLNSVNGGLTWSGSGLAGKIKLSTKNLLGLGQDVSLNLNRKFSLDAKFGGSLDWKNVYYPSGFNFTKLSLYRNIGSNQGVKASFGYPLTGKLSLNMGYKADWILGDDSDGSLTHILSGDLVYDDRNNPNFPTAGTRRSLKLEKAGDFAPGVSFTQLTFTGSYFQGLPTLDIAGKKMQTFGFNLQLGLGMDAPRNYQTEFGGKNSIRGLGSDVASNYGFLNSEYRLQLLPGSLYITSFVDSGFKLRGDNNYDFKNSAGLEINLQIFGHLRLGAAWKLSDEFNYVPSIYFGMGPKF